jgi:hypothetical protein
MFKTYLKQVPYLDSFYKSDKASGLDKHHKCSESELNRSERYGDVHFISFYCAVLARLVYCNDQNFVENYDSIFGQVIPRDIMHCIDNVKNAQQLLDDEKVFGSLFKKKTYSTYERNGRTYIAFEEMAKNVNILIGEDEFSKVKSIKTHKHKLGSIKHSSLRYVSIATSNYGEIYVYIDLTMPNSIFILFRGTYSVKSATSYSRPSSIFSVKIGNKGEAYLDGIFKITVEVMHSIIESGRFLVETYFPKQSLKRNNIKIFTTGHSLGGAMCTIFSYLWAKMHSSNIAPYNSAPYNYFTEEICCISFGAPRCFNETTSKKFCEFVASKKIMFLRVTNRDDPIPGLPNKMYGFVHPCSDPVSIKKGLRNLVTEDCDSVLTQERIGNVKPEIDYNKDLNCRSCKSNPEPGNGHFDYLYVMFTNFDFKVVIDVWDKIRQSFSLTSKNIRAKNGTKTKKNRKVKGTAKGVRSRNKSRNTKIGFGIDENLEIVREKNLEKSTRARLVFYEGGDYFKVVFFDMDKARGTNFNKTNSIISGIQSFINSITGSSKDPNKVVEDVGINQITFDELRTHLTKVRGNVPLDGHTTQFPEYKKDAPKLCCIHL